MIEVVLSAEDVARYAGMSIWDHFDQLLRAGSVTVDRPGGTAHPKVREYVYPLDYGYLDGTDGGDGSGVDVWVGRTAGAGLTALLCTYDPVKRDSEIKLVVDCGPAEIGEIERFYAPQPQAVLVVHRP